MRLICLIMRLKDVTVRKMAIVKKIVDEYLDGILAIVATI
jgi:hypothetical protein